MTYLKIVGSLAVPPFSLSLSLSLSCLLAVISSKNLCIILPLFIADGGAQEVLLLKALSIAN